MSLLSLAHLSVLELTPPEVVSCAAAAGFDACNLRLSPAREGEQQHPMIGDTPMLRETLRRLNDTGLKVLDIEVVWLKPDTVAVGYEGVFATAARLEAKHMIVAGGDPSLDRAAANFAAVCETARPYGLTMVLEFMIWSEIKTLQTALEILKKSVQPNAGILVDALHADRSGLDLRALRSVDPALLPYMQICDAPAASPPPDRIIHEARFDRLPPGEGGLALVPLLGALPQRIDISVETPEIGAAGQQPPLERARRLKAATLQVLAVAASAHKIAG
jgi:sugar phosphate isomerase/epimerase